MAFSFGRLTVDSISLILGHFGGAWQEILPSIRLV
jgi:hypothetical protein